MGVKIKLVDPEVELLEMDPVRKVETAYRICYQSLDKMTDKSHTLIKKCLYPMEGQPHGTPLEHVYVELIVPKIVLQEVSYYIARSQFSYIGTQLCEDFDNPECYLYGNLRAFYTFWSDIYKDTLNWSVETIAVAHALNQAFAEKFPEIFNGPQTSGEPIIVRPDSIRILIDQYAPTFRIVTTRDILQEFVRHRQMSFNVESTRYCNYKKKGFTFVRPKPYDWAENDNSEIFKMWMTSNQVACENYLYLLEVESCKPEEARMLLPGGLKTEFVVTAPEASWDHFCSLRCDSKAHPQIRYLADQIKEHIG